MMIVSLLPIHAGANSSSKNQYASSIITAKINDHIKKMSLEEKVGQLFLIGFQGQDLSQGLEKTIE
ncbi:MAG: hypothetical protein AB7O96_13685, partial [Pseudobdellovibrionaceae bacterium]